MDTAATLEALAKTMPGRAEDALGRVLVSVDTLVAFSSSAARPAAAPLLRDSAAAQTTAMEDRQTQGGNPESKETVYPPDGEGDDDDDDEEEQNDFEFDEEEDEDEDD